jgi:hypothetical protein
MGDRGGGCDLRYSDSPAQGVRGATPYSILSGDSGYAAAAQRSSVLLGPHTSFNSPAVAVIHVTRTAYLRVSTGTATWAHTPGLIDFWYEEDP